MTVRKFDVILTHYTNHARNNLQSDDVIEAQKPVHMLWSLLIMKSNIIGQE